MVAFCSPFSMRARVAWLIPGLRAKVFCVAAPRNARTFLASNSASSLRSIELRPTRDPAALAQRSVRLQRNVQEGTVWIGHGERLGKRGKRECQVLQ
jgi:hypothetical protein